MTAALVIVIVLALALALSFFRKRLAAAYDHLQTHAAALYGTAVLRIGYGTAYLVFLLHEYPNHDKLWGPDAPWSPAMNQQFANDPSLDWFAVDRWWYTFLGHGGKTWFEFWYHAAILVCLLFALGWRTRVTSILFAATIMMFTGRNVYLTDGGDNIMGLMAIYLAFSYCGRTWSLDARRVRRRAGKREPFTWPETARGQVMAELDDVRRRAVTFLHNCAVLVVSAQICVVYAAAGLYKAQGSMWQDGTALYYTLHLNWFRPWPGMSDFIASNSVLIAIVAYLTVFVQIAFPFAVFSRWLKYPVLVMLLGMHASIALAMGLPLFSGAMMIGDAVFIPDRIWQRIGLIVGQRAAPLRARIPVPRRERALAFAGVGPTADDWLGDGGGAGGGESAEGAGAESEPGDSEPSDGGDNGFGGRRSAMEHPDEVAPEDGDLGYLDVLKLIREIPQTDDSTEPSSGHRLE